MWKKFCMALLLGLSLNPDVVFGQSSFDPFDGLSAGISQGMEVGTDVILFSDQDVGSFGGGNVIIGTDSVDTFQGASVDDDLDLEMKDGEYNVQGLNIVQGQIAILSVQGAAIADNVNIASSGNGSSVQGVNVASSVDHAGAP